MISDVILVKMCTQVCITSLLNPVIKLNISQQALKYL